jgi:hypothetical protein
MKKIITFLFLSLYTLLTVYADIDYNVNKYGVMFVNFVVEDEKPTIDLFKSDWNNAINIASSNKSVKQIQFKNADGGLLTWIDKNNFINSSKIFEEIVSQFSSFDEIETTYSDNVSEWKMKLKTPPQYHSDTYKNGKLVDTYSSDWKQGPFPASSSTYKSGGDTYITKTYFTPAKYDYDKPIIERKIIKKGEDVKLSEIYKRR